MYSCGLCISIFAIRIKQLLMRLSGAFSLKSARWKTTCEPVLATAATEHVTAQKQHHKYIFLLEHISITLVLNMQVLMKCVSFDKEARLYQGGFNVCYKSIVH
jgi:hypothetical protein